MDCFMGSGTTCAVAQKLGRRWIGCDINQNAVDIASKRLRNIPHTSIIGNTENRVKKAETSTNSSRSGISQSTTKTFVKPTNFDIE
jgi:DNA modification methylase